jgi:ATP-binding cassette subfamily F protein 3
VGDVLPDAGKVTFGAGVKHGYFDQMLTCFAPEAEVLNAIRPPHKEFIEQQRRDLLAKFGVTGDMVFQKVGSLSGGERNRVALTWLAALDPNFLILDEPTNHLDLWARDALEKALQAYDGTVLFVSHDRYFLNQVATKLLVVEPNRFRVIDGNYDTYQHLLKEGLATEARGLGGADKSASEKNVVRKSAGESDSSVESRKPERRKRKYPYRKAGDVEADIHRCEGRIVELHDLLSSPEILRDGVRVKQLNTELTELQDKLPQLYEHWEEATELNG